MYPPEVNEFRQLEADGWLRDMLRSGGSELPQTRQSGNLATAVQNAPGIEALEYWREQLQALVARMSDSLDEY